MKDRLIELQKEAIRKFMECDTSLPLTDFIADHMIANLDLPVVRCKDCQHCYKSGCSYTGYLCRRWGIYDDDCDCDPNGFCYKGERRTDNAVD